MAREELHLFRFRPKVIAGPLRCLLALYIRGHFDHFNFFHKIVCHTYNYCRTTLYISNADFNYLQFDSQCKLNCNGSTFFSYSMHALNFFICKLQYSIPFPMSTLIVYILFPIVTIPLSTSQKSFYCGSISKLYSI